MKRNFNLCFSRIKCLPTSFSHPLTLDDEQQQEEEYETQQEYIIKRFKTLYNVDVSPSTTTAGPNSDDYTIDFEPDLSSAVTSQRFFVSSPGPTNSILDSALVGGGIAVAVRKYSPNPYLDFRVSMEEMLRARRDDRNPTPENKHGSSIKMINSYTDWEYLHELLLCYLSLNSKHTHKFIISAFTDILVDLSRVGGDCRW